MKDFDEWAAERRRVHDASDDQTQRSIRKRVRARAAELNVPPPAWVAIQKAGPSKTTASRAARVHAPLQAAAVASGASGTAAPGAPAAKPGKAWRHRLTPRRGKAIDAAPSQPVELPAALSAWRAAGYGRCVELRRGSVVLHDYGAKPVKFGSVEAASVAIAKRA